jgi:hypothetical protein
VNPGDIPGPERYAPVYETHSQQLESGWLPLVRVDQFKVTEPAPAYMRTVAPVDDIPLTVALSFSRHLDVRS